MPDNAQMQEQLAQYRKEIDSLDDEIVRLMFNRTKVVEKVGELKSTYPSGKSYIRAGREATLVRRIVSKFAGSKFPPQAAAGIWRMIISASTAIESDFKVSAYTTPQDNSMMWFAREYFGSFTPITTHAVFSEVTGDIAAHKTTVGVLPYPHTAGADNWWPLLTDKTEHSPKIFACIPFVNEAAGRQPHPPALVVGRVTPEPTGDDRTCLMLVTNQSVSGRALTEHFAVAGITVRTVSPPLAEGKNQQHFPEADGFLTPEHEGLQRCLAALGSASTGYYILGAYAAPVTLK